MYLTSTRRNALHASIGALAIALVALAFWPVLGGFWIRDDFMHLALVRVLGHPEQLFLHDHYAPFPGGMYRPLGFASLWLSWKLFGTDYPLNALFDVALHAAVTAALFHLMRALELGRWAALLCALLFALHPSALGTVFWWSDRFDLLATLFCLLSASAGIAYANRPAAGTAAATIFLALVALLSKETALAGCAAIAFVWTRRAIDVPRVRRSMATALALLVLAILALFAARAGILGTRGSGLVADGVLTITIFDGSLMWLKHFPGYLFHWTSLQPAGIRRALILLIAIVAAIAIALAAGARNERRRYSVDALLIGASLLLLPAVLQAPISVLNAARISDTSPAEFAMQSRLYYLSFCGLAILCAILVDAAFRTASRRGRQVLSAAALCLVVALALASHRMAREYASETAQPKKMVKALIEAVDRLDLPAHDCNVVVRGIVRPYAWDIYASADSIVKGLSIRGGTALDCIFDADYPTFYHIVDKAGLPKNQRLRETRGERHAPLIVGDSATLYLQPSSASQSGPTPDFVLRFDGGRFVSEPGHKGVDVGQPDNPK